MGYSGRPRTSPTDAIRLAIGDTSDPPRLTDEEVEYYYQEYGNVLLAASFAASDLAALYAPRVNKSVGGRSISNDQLFQHYTTLAEKLRSQHITKNMGSISAPTIGRIKDSSSEYYPARQRLSDIEQEPIGENEVL